MTPLSLTPRYQWHHWAWLRCINDTADLDSVISMTPLSLTPRYQLHRWAWLRAAWHTVSMTPLPTAFFVHANISAKSGQYAKILQHINKRPKWFRIMTKSGVKNCVTPLIRCHIVTNWQLCFYYIPLDLRIKHLLIFFTVQKSYFHSCSNNVDTCNVTGLQSLVLFQWTVFSHRLCHKSPYHERPFFVSSSSAFLPTPFQPQLCR